MAKDVRCSVTTCAYHDSNNKCLADEQETECGTFKLK